MFEKLKRLRLAAGFVGGRAEDYVRLAAFDATLLKADLVRSAVGFAILALGAFFLTCFLCVAAIVTAWNTESRILVAWLVCAFWALVAGAGLFYASGAFKGPPLFADLKTEFAKDVAAVRELL